MKEAFTLEEITEQYIIAMANSWNISIDDAVDKVIAVFGDRICIATIVLVGNKLKEKIQNKTEYGYRIRPAKG